ncbi:MAG: DUF1232 domain-containing protein [Paludibacteraceae bacterium]|nr:DUF1232 domain-containing protein [Paludibacteraceae bacterium]MBQ6984303.1 DUF1232 domain-containing protein [Paludibacteraceae bacterium]
MQQKTKYKLNIGIGIIAALVYLVIPTDIVPETIPVLGWIDDIIAILIALANAIRLGIKLRK